MAGGQKEFKGLTARTKELLALGEGQSSEYKQSVEGVKQDSIVALANSTEGGAILVGVEEEEVGGVQRGKVLGSAVGDRQKMALISRASDCKPPVPVEIYIENTNHVPIFRIEVPSSPDKPHSTGNGTYKIRLDGGIKPIYPPQLLAMFMDKEDELFVSKFRQAAKELEEGILATKGLILTEIGDLQGQIDDSLREIFQQADSASDNAGEAMGFADETLACVQGLDQKIDGLDFDSGDSNAMLSAICSKLGLETPHGKRMKIKISEEMPALLDKNLELSEKNLEYLCSHPGLSEEVIQQVHSQAQKVIRWFEAQKGRDWLINGSQAEFFEQEGVPFRQGMALFSGWYRAKKGL